MSASGAELRRLSADAVNDSYPRWLPDGRRVLVTRTVTGNVDMAVFCQLGRALPASPSWVSFLSPLFPGSSFFRSVWSAAPRSRDG